jgi:ParB family chromosome partitioning protein
MVAAGNLDSGHAKALLSLPDAPSQIRLAEKVVREFLSVRETEEMVRRIVSGSVPTERTPPARDPNVASAEERLTRSLGTRVRIVAAKKKGTGKIEIDYYSEDELDRLFSLLVARSH